MTIKEILNAQSVKDNAIKSGLCKVCKEIFYTLNIRHKTCSHKCGTIIQTEKMKTGEFRPCANCSKKTWVCRSHLIWDRNFCCNTCRFTFNRDKNLYNFKGWHLTEDGYKKIWNGTNKYVLEHRNVMKNFIGRELKKTEIVHHIDGNKLNNSIWNLQIVSRAEHAVLHKPAIKHL